MPGWSSATWRTVRHLVTGQNSNLSVMGPGGGRGSGGVKSAGVSQSVRETSRDESQNVLSTQKPFKTRDLELPIFEGSLPSCSPHSAGYTCTSVHPYFPVANRGDGLPSNVPKRPKLEADKSQGPQFDWGKQRLNRNLALAKKLQKRILTQKQNLAN